MSGPSSASESGQNGRNGYNAHKVHCSQDGDLALEAPNGCTDDELNGEPETLPETQAWLANLSHWTIPTRLVTTYC